MHLLDFRFSVLAFSHLRPAGLLAPLSLSKNHVGLWSYASTLPSVIDSGFESQPLGTDWDFWNADSLLVILELCYCRDRRSASLVFLSIVDREEDVLRLNV